MNAPLNPAQSRQLAASTQASSAVTTMGFGDLASFEFLQRAAKLFSNSSMVPTAYQAMVTKGYGKNQTIEANPAALSNCVVALDMAQRMNANPLMIMQNLHIIEGRPSWSSQFIIAAINGCGKFSPLRFDVEWMDEMDASYSTFEWVDGRKQELKHTIRIKNARCVAWALEKATGERLESAPVTMEMAVAEGWYGKNGSKWRSMPDLMLRYRSAAFFGRIYAPELLMGLPAAEELHDIIDVRQGADGKYVADLGDGAPQPAVKPAAPARPTLDFYPADRFAEKLPEWRTIVESGKKTPEDLIAMLSTKAVFSDEQRAILAGLGRAEEAQQAGGAPGIDPETGEVMQPDPEHDEFMRGLTGED
ncbi:hypothetical protein [Malikia spinosa]|uniref:hypothetical protein n=1 Tax=Malikia spinosa TaxID=86180 RepID=UPI002FD9E581